ncbi:hypothetical protein HpHA227_14870 [Helicobacter pylori]
MDYSLKVMKNKERKQREKILDSFTIRKELRMGYDVNHPTAKAIGLFLASSLHN